MTHSCHANGCSEVDIHPEVPFCKKHWSMLPEPHQKKLWQGRTKDDCLACSPGEEPENMLAMTGPPEPVPEWLAFTHLGIALLCYMEYGEHDCPES